MPFNQKLSNNIFLLIVPITITRNTAVWVIYHFESKVESSAGKINMIKQPWLTCMEVHTLSKECVNTYVCKPWIDKQWGTGMWSVRQQPPHLVRSKWKWEALKKRKLNSVDLFLLQSRGQMERQTQKASCIMHGPLEQRWIYYYFFLHRALIGLPGVCVLCQTQAVYKKARCSNTTLELICLSAQDHQPFQLLVRSSNTVVSQK